MSCVSSKTRTQNTKKIHLKKGDITQINDKDTCHERLKTKEYMNRHHRPIWVWELGRSEVVTVVSKGCSIWHKNEFDNNNEEKNKCYTVPNF